MREALVRAAKAYPGVVGDMILAADRKQPKRKATGGWSVDRKQSGGKKRGRRNR